MLLIPNRSEHNIKHTQKYRCLLGRSLIHVYISNTLQAGVSYDSCALAFVLEVDRLCLVASMATQQCIVSHALFYIRSAAAPA
jgi:hypothetical protein